MRSGIDRFIGGAGYEATRYIKTSSHPAEPLDEVVVFASDSGDGPTDIVRTKSP